MSYTKKSRDSVAAYHTKLNTGIGGDGSYLITGRHHDAEPSFMVNYASNGAFDYVQEPITLAGKTVSPYFVYYGRDISENSAVATVGSTLVQFSGTGSWAANVIEDVACPASGPDYVGKLLCNSSPNSASGVYACNSNAFCNFGNNDVVLEGFFRPGSLSNPAPIIAKYSGTTATPGSGAGYYISYTPSAGAASLRFRGLGVSRPSLSFSAYPGQWVHFLALIDMGSLVDLYVNGVSAGGSGAAVTGNLDCDYPFILGGTYSSTAPQRHPNAIGFVAAYSAASWLTGVTYSEFALERAALVYSHKLAESNSSTVYVVNRNFPIMNCVTGEIYGVNTISANSSSLFTSNATQNLAGTFLVDPGSNWDCVNTSNSFMFMTIADAGAVLSGQTSRPYTNGAVSEAEISWSTNFTGYTVGVNGYVSMWAQSADCDNLKIVIADDDTNTHTVWVNTTAGTVINASAGVNASIEAASGTWFRIGIVKTNLGTGKSLTLYPAQSGSTSVTISNNRPIAGIWGIKIANGSDPFTDVPITRGGPCNAYSEYVAYTKENVVGAGGGTFRASFTEPGVASTNYNIVSCYEASNTSNSVSVTIDANGDTGLFIGSTSYANFGDLSDTNDHVATIAYLGGSMATSIDGVFSSNTAPDSPPQGIDTIKFNGPISTFKTYVHFTMGS
jgi:hypothetical protein